MSSPSSPENGVNKESPIPRNAPRAQLRASAAVAIVNSLFRSLLSLRCHTSTRWLQHDGPDGAVVADRRGHRERMKELVVAERPWPWVGPAKAVKDGANVVQDASGEE